MRRAAVLLLVLVYFLPLRADDDPVAKPCVVLLHGIGTRAFVMGRLESALTAAGYRAVNLSYPSRRMPFEELAGKYLPEQLRKHDVASAPRLYFVTHSLGSLVVRKFIQNSRPANLARVVMIGPPNHGSAAADEAKENALLKFYFGENLERLGTGGNGIVRTLGPADFDLGIIAGEVALNPLFEGALGAKNDGAVAIDSARLEGMRDFLVVPYSHTAMLWRDEVIRQTLHFLRDGKFDHPATPAEAATPPNP